MGMRKWSSINKKPFDRSLETHTIHRCSLKQTKHYFFTCSSCSQDRKQSTTKEHILKLIAHGDPHFDWHILETGMQGRIRNNKNHWWDEQVKLSNGKNITLHRLIDTTLHPGIHASSKTKQRECSFTCTCGGHLHSSSLHCHRSPSSPDSIIKKTPKRSKPYTELPYSTNTRLPNTRGHQQGCLKGNTIRNPE